MLVSYYSNALVLKIDTGKWLVLGGQQEAIGQEAGPAVEGTLGGNPRQFRKIIAFR